MKTKRLVGTLCAVLCTVVFFAGCASTQLSQRSEAPRQYPPLSEAERQDLQWVVVSAYLDTNRLCHDCFVIEITEAERETGRSLLVTLPNKRASAYLQRFGVQGLRGMVGKRVTYVQHKNDVVLGEFVAIATKCVDNDRLFGGPTKGVSPICFG